MNFNILIVPGVATVAALAWTAPAMADDVVEDRLASMEQRVKYLEERVAAQDQTIVEKEREISALSGMADGWFNSVAIGGVIEVELVSSSPSGEDSSTEAGVATAELAIAAAINDEFSGEILLESDDDDIVLADAFLTYEPGGFSVSVGQQGLPFGVFDTNLVSDPLTEELGDTSGVSVLMGGEADLLNWSVFALNSADDQFAENYGVALGLAMEGDVTEFGLDVSWINDIANDGNPQGIAASARGSLGPFSALGEMVTGIDSGESDAEPSTWMVEAAYAFVLGDRDATAAVGFQGSEEIEDLAETRMLVGISVDVWENVGVGVEWKQEEFAGDDGSADTIAVLLGAEF